MSALFPHGLLPDHQDYKLMKQLEEAILRHANGIDKFKEEIPRLFRQGIDEVIDSARSNRFTLDEIEKTEKTYIGTKIEILLRNHLNIGKGKVLDLLIDGIETDIKNTISQNWTIPSEAMGHPCLLLKADEKKAICYFGIIVIRDEILNRGRNRDGKRTISKDGFKNIHWLLNGEPYPENFWQNLPSDLKQTFISPAGGTDRVAMLFRHIQGKPIPRNLILGLGQQEDPMRRLRKGGGARDSLRREGIAILSGKYDREVNSSARLARLRT